MPTPDEWFKRMRDAVGQEEPPVDGEIPKREVKPSFPKKERDWFNAWQEEKEETADKFFGGKFGPDIPHHKN